MVRDSSKGPPIMGPPSHKLPIPFPYFKGFLWEWYGSKMRMRAPLYFCIPWNFPCMVDISSQREAPSHYSSCKNLRGQFIHSQCTNVTTTYPQLIQLLAAFFRKKCDTKKTNTLQHQSPPPKKISQSPPQQKSISQVMST